MDGAALLVSLGVIFTVLVIWSLRRRNSAPDHVADAINKRLEAPPRRLEPTVSTPSPPEQRPEAGPPAANQSMFAEDVVRAMPARVLFLDVETTGLHSSDRIVTFGALKLETANLLGPDFALTPLHLVFDPTKKSHPQAERVHGWPDWTLRHQDLFADHAAAILQMIESADLLVAHNASFDMRFIQQEMERAGLAMPDKPVQCTMQGWRARGLSRASLSAVCAHLGLSRAGDTHGALEDAGLAMEAWLSLHVPNLRFTAVAYPPPFNFREPPPLPDGPLPRRSPRKARPAT